MKFRRKIKVGDVLYISCFTSMGASSEGDRVVTDVKVKYDENNGEPYDVICFDDHEFHGITGKALTNPSMYYIDTHPLPEGESENELTKQIKAIKERMKINTGVYEND